MKVITKLNVLITKIICISSEKRASSEHSIHSLEDKAALLAGKGVSGGVHFNFIIKPAEE